VIRSVDEPVTAVQRRLAQRRLGRRLAAAVVLVLGLVGVATLVGGGALLARFTGETTPYYADIDEHFKYGSIGSEPASGLPKAVWRALPVLYPEVFEGRDDYRSFGFLYETGPDGARKELPIGLAEREVRGVELVWLNCAICHVGTWRAEPGGERRTVLAMPANNLDLDRFFSFLLEAADDMALAPERLFEAMAATGTDLGPIDRLLWRFIVIPEVREGLLERRAQVLAMLEGQPAWGPGRVDTFNPYKAIHFGMRWEDLAPEERVGAADFPSIFLQGPREGMQLHWDGNNPSLQERNLSAALGAGVTPATVDHEGIERVADWLLDLPPPPSPHDPPAEAVAAGRELFMAHCADCHGYHDGARYVFEGARLGTVVPIDEIGTDPARLDSYTAEFAELQRTLFQEDPEYRFRHFRKTDGYAAMPLDGLWLRGPYLHNGAVPSLRDLLAPPAERPAAFLRGGDVVDGERGGFVSPACTPGAAAAAGFCFDTSLPGNGNGGHLYGTGLSPVEKDALTAYLLTF